MGEKDNQHFIPQGYLRGFTISKEKSLVWEYDKESGQVSNDPQSLSKICSKHFYYAQYDKNGRVDHERLENGFQDIENKTPRILKLIRPVSTGEKVGLSPKDHGTLSFFIALLLTRTPSFRDGIEDFHKLIIETSLEVCVKQACQKSALPALIKELDEKGQLLEQLEVKVKPQVSLTPMIQLALLGGQSLLGKLWSFALPASEMFFVTPDNPVCFQLPEKYRSCATHPIGPFHPLSEVTIPLRKNLALICRPSVGYSECDARLLQFRAVQLDSADTKNINKRTAIAARRYVYAPAKSSALARMVGNLKGTEQRIRF